LGGPGPGRQPDISRGLGELAQGVSDVADAMFINDENRDRVTATRLQGEYRRAYDEGAAKLDPLAKDYQAQVEELAKGIRSDLAERAEFNTGTVQARFNTAMEVSVQGDLATAAGVRRTAISQEAVSEREMLERGVLAQIRQDPDFASEYLKAFRVSAETIAPAINPQILRKMSEKFVDATVTAQVEGLAMSGRIDEARDTLKAQEQVLRPDHVRRLNGRIMEIQKRGVAAARASLQVAVADIKTNITDAEDTSVLDLQRDIIEEMDEDGRFVGPLQQTRAQLIAAVEGKRDALLRGADKLGNAQRLRDAGTLHKQSDVDLIYKNEQNQLDPGPDGQVDANQAINHLVDFAGSTGRMPSEQKAFIANAESGEDEDQMAQAAIIDKRIRDSAGSVDTGAGPRVKRVQAYMDLYGLDAMTASRRVLDKVPDRATLAQRQDQFKASVGPAFVDSVDDFLQGPVLDRGFLAQLFTSEPTVDAGLRERAIRTFTLAYEESGDENVAKEETKRLLQKSVGTTEVGRADKKVMEFPPERMYFQGTFAKELQEDPDLKVRIINADVEGHLKQMNIELPKPPAGLEDRPRYELRADEATRRGLSLGEQPSWELRVMDQFGSLVPLKVASPDGTVTTVRIVAPTPDELKSMPVYNDIVGERVSAAELEGARLSARVPGSLKEAQDRFPFKIPSKGGRAQRILGTPVAEASVKEPELVGASDVGGVGGAKRAASPVPDAKEVQAAIAKDPKKAAPRGIRNNNPGNLEPIKGVTWKGQAQKQTDKRFLTFSDAKFGIRALARDLRVKGKRGLTTISKILKVYAPSHENNTKAYIASVAKRTGLGANQKINFSDEATLKKLVKAIIHHENGVQPYSDAELVEGVTLSRMSQPRISGGGEG
jgi:hypothetical protein